MSLESTREAALICSLITPEDFYKAKSSGITRQHFLTAEYGGYREVWEFFERYVGDQGQTPSISLIQQNYPSFVPVVGYGTVEYEAGQLHQIYLSRAVQGILSDSLEAIATNPVSALNAIMDGLQRVKVALNDRIGFLNDNDILDAVKSRHDASEADEDQFSGIPTGIEVLDLMKRGWQPNELISIVARPGIGKTALLIRFAVEAWANGYRVLFVSPEMSKEEITLRADVMIAHKQGLQNFPTNWQLSTGKMSNSKLEAYERFRKDQTDDRWLTLEMQADSDAFTIQFVLSQAIQHRADIVIVDNIGYIDDDEKTRNAWESMRNVVRAAKKFATTKGVPVIVAQHAKQGAVKKLWDMPELSDVYMGDALAQYSDRLLALAISKTNQLNRHIMLWKNRGDMTFTRKKEISFDINTGNIGQWMETDVQKAKSELGGLYLGLPEGEKYGHTSFDGYDDDNDDDDSDDDGGLGDFKL